MPRQLQTMPGVGPIGALAIETFAPPMGQFRRGRDFAAWLGLVPRQHSSGGKQRLGKTSKMGQRDIRRLLRADQAPKNFTVIKHMAMNLLNRAKQKKSLRLMRKKAGWNNQFLKSILAA